MGFFNSLILENTTVSEPDADGVVTVSGKQKEESILGSIVTYASMPLKVNDDANFVATSTAAKSSIVVGLAAAHFMDYLHVGRGADPISPITRLLS